MDEFIIYLDTIINKFDIDMEINLIKNNSLYNRYCIVELCEAILYKLDIIGGSENYKQLMHQFLCILKSDDEMPSELCLIYMLEKTRQIIIKLCSNSPNNNYMYI